jgi:hypothetical protein
VWKGDCVDAESLRNLLAAGLADEHHSGVMPLHGDGVPYKGEVAVAVAVAVNWGGHGAVQCSAVQSGAMSSMPWSTPRGKKKLILLLLLLLVMVSWPVVAVVVGLRWPG